MKNKVNILSVNVSTLNLNSTVSLFESWISNGEKRRICVTPVNCVLWAHKNKQLKNLYNSADMCLPDGVPLIWASKLLGAPIDGRVTGLDLLPKFSSIAANKAYRFFFLGAKDGVAEKLSSHLLSIYPNLIIAGYYSPPFAERFSDEENNKMITMINVAKPHIVWVSLTAPKQDFWIFDHFQKIDANIMIGVGGAFEVTAGLIPRAPLWMQRNGLEWLFRFFQEPRRLFKRYIIQAPLFIPLIFLQKLRSLICKIE
jgi:N-acetylglucosaminyldiphosphoundecaprenol N-acetyl-beta-D-mannosaminyltransferase